MGGPDCERPYDALPILIPIRKSLYILLTVLACSLLMTSFPYSEPSGRTAGSFLHPCRNQTLLRINPSLSDKTCAPTGEFPEGDRQISRKQDHYNLQMIIAVGFKVNNQRAVQFRKWAGQIV